MTTFVLVLTFLLFATGGLIWGLLRLSSNGTRRPAPSTLALENPIEHSYAPMERLFNPEDLEFLRKQRGYTPRMARQLRRGRRAALQLYLGQVHEDFRRSWTVSRESSHIEGRSELNARPLLRDVGVFYCVYAAAKLQCWFAWFTYARVDASSLVSILRRAQPNHEANVTELPVIARGR